MGEPKEAGIGPSKRRSITRRAFAGAAAGAALAAGLTASELHAAVADEDGKESDGSGEKVSYTYHPMNCGNRCSMKCVVRDGKLVHISANEWTDPRYSVCCLKGISEISRIYSDDRLKTPLRRVGERGEGKFEEISWEEALDEVADALSKSRQQYGGESIFVPYSSSIEYPLPLLSACLNAQTVIESGIDMGIANGLDRTTGNNALFAGGIDLHESYDWKNAKTLFFVGNNILETGITEAQLVLEAQAGGTKLVVIDPNFTATAGKADEWVSIRPGSDAALYLGMLSTIVEEQLYDEDFLKAHTTAPFLVDDEGALVRSRMEVSEEDTPETNPYLVWDEASQSAVPYTQVSDPALEGEHEVDGTRCRTVFSLIAEDCAQYDVQWAQDACDVPAETIQELARTYADGPCFLEMGYGGADKFSNADITGHAAGLLAAFTGNIGKTGAGIGQPFAHTACEGTMGALGAWPLPEECVNTPLVMSTSAMPYTENPVHVVVNCGNTLVQHFGNFAKTREWLKKLDFIVTLDIYHNDSVDWSDIVLPVCSSFEVPGECGYLQVSKNHVLLQQKVIDPLFDSKSDFEIEQELAARLGFSDLMPKSIEEYTKARLTTDDPLFEGITYDALMENHGIMPMNASGEVFDLHAGGTFFSSTGLMELYHDELVDFNQALPHYEAPIEAYEGNELAQTYPLVFTQKRKRHRVHSQFYGNAWLDQIDESPYVELHPDDAQERGLSTGDAVRIFNDRGSFNTKVLVNECIRAGQAVMIEGAWMRNTGDSYECVVNGTLLDRGALLPYGPVIPFYDTLVQIEKA